MKKLLTLLLVMVSILGMSEGLKDIIEQSKENNLDYQLLEMDKEISDLDYEKKTIESINTKTDISAEISLLSNKKSYNNTLLSIYTKAINTYYELINTQYDKKIKEISYENAKIEYDNNKKLYEKGLIAKQALTNSEISYSNAKIELDQIKYTLKNSINDYNELIKIAIEKIQLEIPNYSDFIVTNEEYINKNIDLKVLELNIKLAQYDLDNMSYNTSEYDKKLLEIALKKANLNYENSKKELNRNHESIINNLESTYISLENIEEQIKMAQQNYNDAKNRYEKGLIAKKELNQNEINLYTSLKSKESTLKSYFNQIINYYMAIGLEF